MIKLMSRREALVTVGNSLLLLACGGGGGGGSSATSKLSGLIASMNLRHEAYPHGVPASYDWRQGPVTTMGCYPHSSHLPDWATEKQKSFSGYWSHITSWFVVYRASDNSGADLNKSTNTGVLVGPMSLWLLSRKTKTWTTVYSSELSVWCSAVPELAVGQISSTNPVKARTSDGIVCLSPIGYCSHGGQDRVPIPLDGDDIAAMVGTIDHRLERINASLPDDTDLAKFIVQYGVDYYPNASATINDLGGYAPAAVSGQFLYSSKEWRTSTIYAKADDVSESTILDAGWPIG